MRRIALCGLVTVMLVTAAFGALKLDKKRHSGWNLETAEELGLRGDPGDCRISSIIPTTLYAGFANQEIKVFIRHLFDEPTTVLVEVSSDLLPEKFTSTINLTGREEQEITIPIPSIVSVGEHTVTVNLLCENGNVDTYTETIYGMSNTPIVVQVGGCYTLSWFDDIDRYPPIISDSNVATISGKQIVGVSEGRTFVTFGESKVYIPIYVTSDGSNPLPQKP